ncbi:MAG: ABC transporter transmembrane domain-containing protein, partial [Maritimibacter sp.]
MRRLPISNEAMANKQRGNGWTIIRRTIPYLWPEGQTGIKIRVILAMVFLFGGRIIGVLTPQLYGAAVDALTGDPASRSQAWQLAVGAIGRTVAYGLARVLAAGFDQLRSAVFAKVAQGALRALALETFTHIHALSLRFHITRKTGGLSRIVERGVKGVEFLLRFLLFSIVPLIFELLLVAAIFFWQFNDWYLGVVALTIAIYVRFTLAVTEWRVKIRKQMNDQDTDANQKAIDSLLNFETVNYFSAEQSEAERYDRAMAGYEVAAIKTAQSLSFLNFGQAFIITTGLVAVMVMAATGVQNGTLTVGDFVMVNAYMVQITMPLNFLGSVYREIRQALTDMGEMFDLLEQPAEVTDKPDARPLAVNGGHVRFDNVSFGYETARPILHGISVDVPAGQTVALVGPSGSGKSTIGRLMFRFYDVVGGAISIDGQDLRDVTQVSVHEAIG